MTPEAEAFAILKAAMPTGPLAVADAFAVPNAPGLAAPVQGLVVSAGGSPLAVIGLAPPTARAQRAPYLVAWNLRDTALRPTPQKGIPALASEPLRRYPTLFDLTPRYTPQPAPGPCAPGRVQRTDMALTQADNDAFGELRAVYGDERLRVPPAVTSHTDAGPC